MLEVNAGLLEKHDMTYLHLIFAVLVNFYLIVNLVDIGLTYFEMDWNR